MACKLFLSAALLLLLSALVGASRSTGEATGGPRLRGSTKTAGGSFAPQRTNFLYHPGAIHQRLAVGGFHKQQHGDGAGNWMDSPWRRSSPVVRIPGDESDEGDFSIGMSMTRLSPDGQTMVSGHWLSRVAVVGTKSQAEQVKAFQLHTFTYMDKLSRWIPQGHFTVSGDSATCPECFDFIFSMEMASRSKVILQQGIGLDRGEVLLSKVQVYSNEYVSRDVSPWLAVGPPIVPVDNSSFIRSVSIADEATFVAEGVVVSVGLLPKDNVSPGSVQIWTPETEYHEEDQFLPKLKWVTVGSAIQGNNALFGFDIKLSRNGSIVAIVGSKDAPNSDDPRNLSCFIRVYKYSEDDSEWMQMGQDLIQEKDKFMFFCPKISLAGDGLTVMSGYRAYEKGCDLQPEPNGHVRVWSWDASSENWNQKGLDLDGLFPTPDSPQDFVFGFDHRLSSDGNRVAISGYESVPLSRASDKANVYYIVTFDWRDGNWTQVPGTVDSGVFASFAMDDAGTTLAVGNVLSESRTSGVIQSYKYRSWDDAVST
ncbi:Membrane [Seminavis robusta]|uniref:Membrane n=1 Tax=Seminavis robusta TaxID=568900 RepID=A0A9N8D989_9STRA|nr:Membrane [Seminavis robusta]|eukprot:Sro21_g014580.1 Membrane (538) ;mRNA; f:48039-49652